MYLYKLSYSKNRKITSLKSNIFDPINREKDKNKESGNKLQGSINYSIDIIDNTKVKKTNKFFNKKPQVLIQKNSKKCQLN